MEPQTPKKLRKNSSKYGYEDSGSDIVSSTPAQKLRHNVAPLGNYSLGDCLGKGGYATVYRAINWGTGETVAIKQIKLVDVAKYDLETIMMEIDLLKNLHHPNIVKYHGFIKTSDTLNIILEYCENGSLASMCKKFGKFPENLAAVYISQVLEGLAFLHEQGTIHRDIKGANILTTKDGLAKLADFGVATKITKLEDNPSVVGTPNWMAPEVIELNGATTASDIWSLGCTVIELLTGNPPYYRLSQMQALFAIVNNDHPPIPEGISPIVQDFLMQCFQKDHNLRVTAKKLLKHPWISNNAKALQKNSYATTKYDEAIKTVQKWNEALSNPQDALHSQKIKNTPLKKSKSRNAKKPTSSNNRNTKATPRTESDPFTSLRNFSQTRRLEFRGMMQRNNLQTNLSKPPAECWDDDFSQENLPEKLSVISDFHQKPVALSSQSSGDSDIEDFEARSVIKHPKKTSLHLNQKLSKWQERDSRNKISQFHDNTQEDFSDLIGELDIGKLPDNARNLPQSKMPMYHPSDLTGIFNRMTTPESPKTPEPIDEPLLNDIQQQAQPFNTSSETSPQKAVSLNSFQENEDDYDYSDMFSGHTNLQLDEKRKHLFERKDVHFEEEENDSDDPFAEIEEEYKESNIVENVARERLAYAQSYVESIIDSLNKNMKGSYLLDCIEQLHQLLCEFPETGKTIMKSHGLLILLEVLELHVEDKILVLGLLQILFLLLDKNYHSLENFCLVGGIPLVAQFTSKKYGNDIRMQAAMFIGLLCDSEKYGLPMLLACGGLYILADFIEEDFTQPGFVSIGVNGLWSVFELQGSAPRNDICRKLSKHSVLDSLSVILKYLLFDSSGENMVLVDRIVSIFVYFSQTESHVKCAVANRTLFRTLFKSFSRMDTHHQLSILKFIKNMSSVPEILPILQNSNAIEHLTDILDGATKKEFFKDYANQILHTMYNLCRLSKVRQEEAALAGILPVLQNVVAGDLPLKEFALPILCDMAHSGKTCRKVLWQNNGLDTYLKLASDPYWQVKAYEAIATWLQEEFAKVEDYLLDEKQTFKLLDGLEEARGTSFDAVLEPFQRIMRSSPALCGILAIPRLFQLIKKQLDIPRPMLRLNLLRLLRTILEYFPSKNSLVKSTGLYLNIQVLSESDDTVLVKELTKDLLNFSMPNEKELHSRNSSISGRSSSGGSDQFQPPISGPASRRNSLLQPPMTSHRHTRSATSNLNDSQTPHWSHRPDMSQIFLPTSSQLMLPPKSPSRKTKHSHHASLQNPMENLLPKSSLDQTVNSANLGEPYRSITPSPSTGSRRSPESFHSSSAPYMNTGSKSPSRSPARKPQNEHHRIQPLILSDKLSSSSLSRSSRYQENGSTLLKADSAKLRSPIGVDPFL